MGDDACYRAEDHDTADLCAQWRAALAAEKAAHEARRATNWTIGATLASILAIAGLIITIWQTHGALSEARRGNRYALLAEKRARREAREGAQGTADAIAVAQRNADAVIASAAHMEKTASAAERSAAAAEKSVETMREIGERRSRASIVVSDVTVAFDRETRTEFQCTITNTGPSRAQNVFARVTRSVWQIPRTSYIPTTVEEVRRGGLAENLIDSGWCLMLMDDFAAQESRDYRFIVGDQLNEEDTDRLMNLLSCVGMKLHIHLEDVFEKHRFSEFVYEAILPPGHSVVERRDMLPLKRVLFFDGPENGDISGGMVVARRVDVGKKGRA
nr:hypothetical protein GCM10017606_25350 [Microbacterium terregens]